ncbi:MAG: hypothetical protein GY724_27920 [Actinomycetia bacterium]|nr:hypothetical protein [Actinomycetes bacterium]MCP4222100.1 hypothetical protein [Actinomycetes bacterium]MCP5031867.1 hypothetical protein [Actinomycetes bacterium]
MTVIVAELDVFHSRPIAPTRRVALGTRDLPVDPAPGAGGVLLAGIVANCAPNIAFELREDLVDVIDTLAAGERVVQPRVRHRFQRDQVGLTQSPQRLIAVDGALEFDFEDTLGHPVQLVLGAVYAAASLPAAARPVVFEIIKSSLAWGQAVDNRFISFVMGGATAALVDLRAWNDPTAWAMEILEIKGDPADGASRRLVQRRFRALIRQAHPDHGGLSDHAADRIADLSEARRILLTS